MIIAARVVVFLAAFYLLILAGMIFLRPANARNFLGAFASSASMHYLEMLLRIIVGVAFLIASKTMAYSTIYYVFGMILIITSIGLLTLPWRWHQRFALVAVPFALKFIHLIGLVALIFGGFLIYCLQ